MPQKMPMRNVNMSWVSAHQLWESFSHLHLHSDEFILYSEPAATRLQAKYKGYRAKGEFRKQKEAGEYLQ